MAGLHICTVCLSLTDDRIKELILVYESETVRILSGVYVNADGVGIQFTEVLGMYVTLIFT